MKSLHRAILALAAAGAALSAQPSRSKVAVPASPAGRAATAFLAAVNGDDNAGRRYLTQFVSAEQTRDSTTLLDEIRAIRSRSGGFEVVSVTSDKPERVELRLKNGRGMEVALAVEVRKVGERFEVAVLELRPIATH